jgi:uncharacterized protein
MPCLQAVDNGVLIHLFVQPRASKNQLAGVVEDELKVRLTSPPVDGAANALCIKYFAKLLGIAKSELELVAGEKSRHKRLLVKSGDLDVIRQILGVAQA